VIYADYDETRKYQQERQCSLSEAKMDLELRQALRRVEDVQDDAAREILRWMLTELEK